MGVRALIDPIARESRVHLTICHVSEFWFDAVSPFSRKYSFFAAEKVNLLSEQKADELSTAERHQTCALFGPATDQVAYASRVFQAFREQ